MHVIIGQHLMSSQQTLPSRLDANGQPKPDTEMSTWELMKSPGVAIVVFIYSHVIFQALCFTAGMLQTYTSTNLTVSKHYLKSHPSPNGPLSVSEDGASLPNGSP